MRYIYPFLFLCVVAAACTPQVYVNYSQISVPEEGGINFTQFTRDDEAVMGPRIEVNEISKVLGWYAPAMIAVSPDGEKLAYLAKSNEYFNLYIKNIAGGRATVQRTFNRNVLDMSYSPDGKHITFSESKNNDMNVYMINATEGAAVQQLTSSNYSELGPTFAPKGDAVYFTKQEGERYYIWDMNLNSSLFTQYSEGFTPVLTPDGKNLIITRNSRDGARGEIWMVNLERGTETMILNDPELGFSSPSISPDGDTILCVGTTPSDKTRPQNLNIFSIKLDGTNLRQLTFHGGHDVSPVWSPDGQNIFFISQRGNSDGEFNVWRMNYKN